MANPTTGILNLVANRWEPFVYTIDFEEFDYSAASFIAQVRLTRDAGGTPLVNLSTVGGVGTEGITIVGVITTDGVATTSISIRIKEATIEALPEPIETGDDVTLYYDLQITPSGGVKYRALEGTFTVHAGVTH
jgi:hypothetical protein